MTRQLLVVHHTSSPALHTMFDAVISGASNKSVGSVRVLARPALSTGASDVLSSDGFVLGTPANIGYMSGALKHFFDQIYYPCLEATPGRPYAVYVHGNNDTTGAVLSIESVVAGLRWRRAQMPVEVIGPPSGEDLSACWELGAAMSALLGEESQ